MINKRKIRIAFAVLCAVMGLIGHMPSVNHVGMIVTENAKAGSNDGWSTVMDMDDDVTIRQQPTDVTVDLGGSVHFQIKASGGDLTYQWQLSDDQGQTWRNSSVKTADYYTTLSEKNAGRYVRCIVSNSQRSSAISRLASMNISPLSVVTQPTDFAGVIGDQVNIGLKINGVGLIYQWQLSDDQGRTWRNSSVKTHTYMTLLSEKNNGRYVRCKVSDKYGNMITTDAAQMRVTSLSIIGQPKDTAVKIGEVVHFRIKATGEGLNYQWQLSDDGGNTWRNSSVRTAEYAADFSQNKIGRYVRCIVTDEYGAKIVSDVAIMKLQGASRPILISQPKDCLTEKGKSVHFVVAATGENLTYQWQLSDDEGKNWRNSSIKTAEYDTTLSDKNNGRYVRCVVTDKYGNSVKSNAAVMKIK